MQPNSFVPLSANANAADQHRTMYGSLHPSQHYEAFMHPDEEASAASISSQDLSEMRHIDSDLRHYPRYHETHGSTPVNNAPDHVVPRMDANYYPPKPLGQSVHDGQWQNFRSDSMSSISSNQSNYPYDWPHSHHRDGDVTPNSDYYARSRSTSYTSVATNASHATFTSRSSANSSYMHPHPYVVDGRSRGSSHHSTGHYDILPYDQAPGQYRPRSMPNNMYNQAPPHDPYAYGGYYNPPEMMHPGPPMRRGDVPQDLPDHLYPQCSEAYPNTYRNDASPPHYGPDHHPPPPPHRTHPHGYRGHPSYRGWSEANNYEEGGHFHHDIPYDPIQGSYVHSEKSGTDTSVSSLCSRVSSLSIDSTRDYGDEYPPQPPMGRMGQPRGTRRETPHSERPMNRPSATNYPVDYSNPRVDNIKGRVISIARSQTGCKDLVSLLSTPDAVHDGVAEAVLNEIAPYAQGLSLDPNGNYVMQQLIKTLPLDLRLVLLYCITGRIGRDELPHHLPSAVFDSGPAVQDIKTLTKYNFEEPEDAFLPPLVQLSLSNHGTHVVQCLVDYCTEPVERYSIMAPFRMKPSSVARLCRDSNGCHVIMRLFRIGEADSTWVISRILEDLLMLSKQKHGAPIIMQAIDAATTNMRRMLVNTVIKSAKILASDPCANFIISHVLSTGTKAEANSCALALLGSIRSLAVKKHGSNVVERCLGAVKPGPQAGRSLLRNKHPQSESTPNSMPLVSASVIAQVLEELLNLNEEEVKKIASLDPAAPVPEQMKNDAAKEINALLSSTYGNYVVDRVFDAVFLAGPIYVRIFEESLSILLPTLKDSQISKGFTSRVSSRFPHLMDKKSSAM